MAEISLVKQFTGIDIDLDVSNVSKKDLMEQLRLGIIPTNLREEWELVDEDSSVGLSFQDYMTDVTKTLLRAAYTYTTTKPEGCNGRAQHLPCQDSMNENQRFVVHTPLALLGKHSFYRLKTLFNLGS